MLAILTKDISFNDLDQRLVTLRKGTQIFVDTKECVAFHNDIHFSIEMYEVTIVQ